MNKYIITSVVLMVASSIMLFLGFSYYSLAGDVVKIVYSDKDEYNDVQKGLDFIDTLPMSINVINEYFSDINNLSQESKEKILLSYVIKNNYKFYDCGSSTNKSVFCINKSDLNNVVLLNKLGLNMTISNDNIDTYIDKYGFVTFKSNDSLDYYKVSYVTNSYQNTSYTEFYKYKKDGDKYIFYVYQGFYKANCTLGEKVILYDYITGKEIYRSNCNVNNNFVDLIEDYSNLQLYKYELKKDESGEYYLYGYNPVNNFSISN